jgi:hypothetical protein
VAEHMCLDGCPGARYVSECQPGVVESVAIPGRVIIEESCEIRILRVHNGGWEKAQDKLNSDEQTRYDLLYVYM